MSRLDHDFVIIGGGFYGCCLALALRSISDRIVILEREDEPMTHASRVNQARVHTGFHYPRSFVTALRCLLCHERFARDFPNAIADDFDMLYAIARRRSKVSPQRFWRMFSSIDAPIEAANKAESSLFSDRLIARVFRVREYAFDHDQLRAELLSRIEKFGIDVRYDVSVDSVEGRAEGAAVQCSDGSELTGETVFNVSYSMINSILGASGLPRLDLKHEFVEIALAAPPPELAHLGITVMDGPFFSLMPFPAASLHSLTHVRYTPRVSWRDQDTLDSPYAIAERLPRETRWRHMAADACRYVPVLNSIEWKTSMFDVKTLLMKNERDDGRPILFHRHEELPSLISVMGGKIDNIYDLFAVLPDADPRWRDIHTDYLFGKPA